MIILCAFDDILSTVNTWQLFNKKPIIPHSKPNSFDFHSRICLSTKTLFISWLRKYLSTFHLYAVTCLSFAMGLSFHIEIFAIFILFQMFYYICIWKSCTSSWYLWHTLSYRRSGKNVCETAEKKICMNDNNIWIDAHTHNLFGLTTNSG